MNFILASSLRFGKPRAQQKSPALAGPHERQIRITLTAGAGEQAIQSLAQVLLAHATKETFHFAAVWRKEDKDRLVGNAEGLYDIRIGSRLTVEIDEIHVTPVLSF